MKDINEGRDPRVLLHAVEESTAGLTIIHELRAEGGTLNRYRFYSGPALDAICDDFLRAHWGHP
jgi:hypothetical protein